MPEKGKGVNIQYMYVLVTTNHNQLLPPPLARSASIRLSSSAEGLSSGSVIQQASISWKKDMLLEQGVEDKLVPGIVGQRDLTLLAVSGLWPPSWPPPWWPRWRRGCRPGWLSPRAALPGTRHRIWPHFDCSSKPPWPEKYCCSLRKVLLYHPSRAVWLLSWFWPSWHSKSSQLCSWGAEHFQIIVKKTFLCYLSLPPWRHSEHKQCYGKCPVDADGASQRQDRLQVQATVPPLKYQSISDLRSIVAESARQLMFTLAFNSCLGLKLVTYTLQWQPDHVSPHIVVGDQELDFPATIVSNLALRAPSRQEWRRPLHIFPPSTRVRGVGLPKKSHNVQFFFCLFTLMAMSKSFNMFFLRCSSCILGITWSNWF